MTDKILLIDDHKAAARRAAIHAALAMNLHGTRPEGFHGSRSLIPIVRGDPQARERARAKRAELLARRREAYLRSGGQG